VGTMKKASSGGKIMAGGIAASIAMFFIIAGATLFFLFRGTWGHDNIADVRNHTPEVMEAHGFTATFGEIFDAFIESPQWREHSVGGEIGVEVGGILRGSDDRLFISWMLTPSATARNLYYLEPFVHNLNGTITHDADYIDEFLFFMFEIHSRGLSELPIEEWTYSTILTDPTLFGYWRIHDETAAGWFEGGEILTFFDDGFGYERWGNHTWDFEWFTWRNELDLHYGNFQLSFTYRFIGRYLHLTDNEGNSIVFSKDGDITQGPSLVGQWFILAETARGWFDGGEVMSIYTGGIGYDLRDGSENFFYWETTDEGGETSINMHYRYTGMHLGFMYMIDGNNLFLWEFGESGDPVIFVRE